jgi:hypothetical protein
METLGRVGASADTVSDDASTTVKRADFFTGVAAEPLSFFFVGFARVVVDADGGLSVGRFDADARGVRRRRLCDDDATGACVGA